MQVRRPDPTISPPSRSHGEAILPRMICQEFRRHRRPSRGWARAVELRRFSTQWGAAMASVFEFDPTKSINEPKDPAANEAIARLDTALVAKYIRN
jgi:hypothetical protein